MIEEENDQPKEKEQKKDVDVEENVLSKNARKRLLKAERREQHWAEKKRRKKEQKREERERMLLRREEMISRGELEDTKDKERRIDPEDRRKRKEAEKRDFLRKCEENFMVVIDCSFEKEHSESSLRSLSQQIMHSYGANRRSARPCRLLVTGIEDEMERQLQKTHCENWTAASVHREGYLEVLRKENRINKVIYLTADSPHTISSLETDTAYVIGGIVDRNRLKGVTYEKAVRENVETARLPLDDCIRLMGNSKTKVLTVNHVFEILLKYAESSSWVHAFQTTLPDRKNVVSINDNDKGSLATKSESDVNNDKGERSNNITE